MPEIGVLVYVLNKGYYLSSFNWNV